MREIIKKPTWVKGEVHRSFSNNISKFFENYNIINYDNIDMNFLRDYYRLDKESCINLIDEFTLRGYIFVINKPSQLIPKVEYNDTTLVIRVNNNNNSYLKINYDRLGLANFIKRFNINNDYFFDSIKLDYFKYLNRDINIKILIEEFKNNDFDVVDFINECNSKENVDIIQSDNKPLEDNMVDDINNTDISSDLNINSIYENANIDCLKLLGVHNSVIEVLKNKFFVNILKDLNGINITKIENISGIGGKKCLNFYKAIERLNGVEDNLFCEVLEEIKELNDFNIYKIRAKYGKSQEKIGEEFGYTKQNVSRKEILILNAIRNYFDLFKDYFFNKIQSKSIIQEEDFWELYDSYDDIIYIKYAIKMNFNNYFVYIEEIDKYINRKEVDSVLKMLHTLIENLPEIFKFSEEREFINDYILENNINFISDEDILEYLTVHDNYKKLNDYLWKGKTTLAKLYAFVIKEHFKEGIRIDESSILQLKNIIEKEFGIIIEAQDRAIGVRIANELVLCDRGKYIHPEYIDISIKLLNEIKEYIDQSDGNTLMIIDIFNVFKEKLRISNITNRYYLHGILRYYYEREFNFTRDTINKSEFLSSSNKVLEDYLLEIKRAANINELRKMFPGWTPIMYSNAVKVNESILKWDIGEYIHSDNINITEEDKLKLKEIIDLKLINEGSYINVNSIYNAVKLKVRNLFKNNNINNANNLYCILEYKLKDIYNFKRNLIFDNSVEFDNKVDVFEEYINSKRIINYEQFFRHFLERKFNESTIYAALQRVTSKLLQINISDYIKKDEIILTEDNKMQIKKFLDKNLFNREYIALLSIDDYKELPDLGYDWSAYLLSDLVKEYFNEYRILQRSVEDRRYKKPIIVKTQSKLFNIIDLIIYIIENEYNDYENMTIPKISDYLISNNIIGKVIPKEFYKSERILVDDFNRIQILKE